MDPNLRFPRLNGWGMLGHGSLRSALPVLVQHHQHASRREPLASSRRISPLDQQYLPRRAGIPLRLVRLPAYSPGFNADKTIWGWIREEVTANTCFGTST